MDHPFEIGEIYENRNGAYEVARIDETQGTMVIRYLDSGEEQEAKIDMQARIWRNIQWDDQAARREKASAAARHQYGYGTEFAGLAASDFKTNTEGTTWRSRQSLGGTVAKLLSAASSDPSYTFVSWAIYGWPVTFLTHLENYQIAAYEYGVRKAKFTIELDEQYAYYGFYIERSNEPMDRTWDWPQLWRALQQRPSLVDRIAEVEALHGARFLGRVYSGEENFHFADGPDKGARYLWDEQNPSRHTVAERLQRIEETPSDKWVEIYLISTTPKDEALRAGVQIAHTMADAMKTMLPIYTAATRG